MATDADRHLTLDDYINGYLQTIVKHLRSRTGSEQVSLLGYCMGGTMSAMFTALHPQYVKNLIMLAAGIDFSTREGLLEPLVRREGFRRRRLRRRAGQLPRRLPARLFPDAQPGAEPRRQADHAHGADGRRKVPRRIPHHGELDQRQRAGARRGLSRFRQASLSAEPARAEPHAGRPARRSICGRSPVRC